VRYVRTCHGARKEKENVNKERPRIRNYNRFATRIAIAPKPKSLNERFACSKYSGAPRFGHCPSGTISDGAPHQRYNFLGCPKECAKGRSA
jgi:Fe-S-cluster-containing hydrogenase component 2